MRARESARERSREVRRNSECVRAKEGHRRSRMRARESEGAKEAILALALRARRTHHRQRASAAEQPLTSAAADVPH
eukprot:5625589-Pleurochrysis_carterae.AAC.1